MNCYILFLQFISVSEYVVHSCSGKHFEITMQFVHHCYRKKKKKKSVCGLQGKWKEGDREMWLHNLTVFLLLPALVTSRLSETGHKTIREH